MCLAAINLKKQMRKKLTLTSLLLSAKFTPRQTSEVLSNIFSVEKINAGK